MIKKFNSIFVTMFYLGKIGFLPGTFGSLATVIFLFDEFIGQAIPIYLYEISHGTEKTMDQALIIYTVCFILFRFFDILKPFPVSYFDTKYKNSFGVVMDDVCAGLYVVLSLICFMILKSLI